MQRQADLAVQQLNLGGGKVGRAHGELQAISARVVIHAPEIKDIASEERGMHHHIRMNLGNSYPYGVESHEVSIRFMKRNNSGFLKTVGVTAYAANNCWVRKRALINPELHAISQH